MRRVHLTKQGAVVLASNLELKPQGDGRPGGYRGRDLRRLDRLVGQLRDSDYVQALEFANDELEAQLRRVESEVELTRVQAQRRARIRALDEVAGDEPLPLLWEDSDYEFVQRIWNILMDSEVFLGSAETRRLVLAIDDALTSAETVDLRALNTDSAATTRAS